jgi:uncharacterized protein YbgA (DUF1722 family)/uncharacterized protein YbbK (DUF523 family)
MIAVEINQKRNPDAIIRPVLLVSRCLGFDHCRWDGGIISSHYTEKLKEYVNVIPVCPEFDIGLGAPRKPVRLVKQESGTLMLQQTTCANLTEKMNTFSSKFLAELQPIDGFLFRDRSPSCGISNVKIYADTKKGSAVKLVGNGLFGSAFKQLFPMIPCASEGHLHNFMLREHFYTQIYVLARFRAISRAPLSENLVDFHTSHKLILMNYHQAIMHQLNTLVASAKHSDIRTVFEQYFELLRSALAHPPKAISQVNVLQHALGYFSEQLTSAEKQFFLNLLEQYLQKKIPLSACIVVVKAWIVRFDEKYLAKQLFFSPWPEALMELSDSGK